MKNLFPDDDVESTKPEEFPGHKGEQYFSEPSRQRNAYALVLKFLFSEAYTFEIFQIFPCSNVLAMLYLYHTIANPPSAPQPERNDSFMTIDSGSDFRDAVTNETGTESL